MQIMRERIHAVDAHVRVGFEIIVGVEIGARIAAFAPSVLNSVSVTAGMPSSVPSSLTVMTFKGVDTSGTNGSGAIGGIASGTSASGAPTASLTTTRLNSLVIGVGNDPRYSKSKVFEFIGTPESEQDQLPIIDIAPFTSCPEAKSFQGAGTH